jgi:hypothetical protein
LQTEPHHRRRRRPGSTCWQIVSNWLQSLADQVLKTEGNDFFLFYFPFWVGQHKEARERERVFKY